MKFRHATNLEDYISILESDETPLIYKYILCYYKCFMGDVINYKYTEIYSGYTRYIQKYALYFNNKSIYIQNSNTIKKLTHVIINLDYESVNDIELDISNCLELYEKYAENFFTDDFFYYPNDIKIRILKDIFTNCTYKYNLEIHTGDLSEYIKSDIYKIVKTHRHYYIWFSEYSQDKYIVITMEDIKITDPLIRASMPKYYVSICVPMGQYSYTVNTDLDKYNRDYKIKQLLKDDKSQLVFTVI